MKWLNKFIGLILAVLFIATAVPALILFNFDHRAFTVETYQTAFAKSDFYAKLPEVMAKAMIASGSDQSQLPIVLRGMSQQAWEAFFRTLLPQETLEAMSDEILASVFAYLNMQSDSVQVSLTPIKSVLVSDSGVQAVLALLGTQPACTLDQIFQMSLNLLSNGEIQICNPPAELYPLLTPVIQGQMQIAAQTLPSQFTLVTAPPENDPRESLRVIRIIMRFSMIFPLMFLLMLNVFMVSSLKSWLNWWGYPFIIIGASAILFGLGGAPIVGVIFRQILIDRMPVYLPAILLDYADDLASAMVQAIFNPILWQGLGFILIGLAMVIAAFFVKSTGIRSQGALQK
jgi:hypothetical protein